MNTPKSPNNMNAQASQIFNFIVAKHKASEAKPLQIGNVKFWHPIEGFGAGLCYDISTHQWDAIAVQNDLNKLAEPIWDELVAHIASPTATDYVQPSA